MADNALQEQQPKSPAPNPEELQAKFNNALKVVDDIVLKNYVTKIDTLEVVPLANHLNTNLDPAVKVGNTNFANNVRFFKINQMVYEKDEFSTYKFASVFNALSTLNCSVFVMIDSNGIKSDFYMGVQSVDSDRSIASLTDTLKNALQGQFPGIKFPDNNLTNDEMRGMLHKINAQSISAVSCVANTKDSNIRDNKSFVQGLEKLVLSLQGKAYTAIFLANGTTQEQLTAIRQSYENIYTQLAPFAKTQVGYNSNNSMSISQASTIGKSISTTITNNFSYTKTTGTSTTDSHTQSTSTPGAASKAVAALSVVASGLGAALAVPTGGASLGFGMLASQGFAQLGRFVDSSDSEGHSQSKSFNVNESYQKGGSDSKQTGQNESKTDSTGITTGTGETLMLNLENKNISDILERLDIQLKRLREFESLGMWECAAYFISDKDPYVAEIAASTYKALMRGENSGVEVSAVNSWSTKNSAQAQKVRMIQDYLTHFIHPAFAYNNPNGASIEVTPCCLVSGNELAIHMGLPRKSVCGFPVIEHADFGKEVNYVDSHAPGSTIKLGKIYNMGSDGPSNVNLDINSLSMHTFITGSTGSGKSNTIYELLRQLNNNGVKYMVVEPAKGEYKNIFGNRPGVTVLGTNPMYTQLLRINPFKFPKGVHVLEHIDRLVEIFNVCWPMYAAMPAVLKDALLQAYQVCGWDLAESSNSQSDDLFPTFLDLQNELVEVIKNSAYSEEVKSNYTGSLATRVNSLTNGLNGQIFSANEIDNEILFDSNVIIDLSRIGSLETKSLIMGVLVMRLNEHRMSYSKGMNIPLKHVTVLEEAHNILKRTSTEQDPESPNVTGKSVEMLSNSIAEMRTYGEGFIIADQSPSAVDLSAIRNTNTKIIMRLPDETDRRSAGKSAALKDEQLDEIAKLSKGVAVVYQNDWLEPVLCHISRYSGQEEPYEYDPDSLANQNLKCDDAWVRTEILKFLLADRLPQPEQVDLDRLVRELPYASLSTKNKIGIGHLIREYRVNGTLRIWKDDCFADLSKATVGLLDCRPKIEGLVNSALTLDELNQGFAKIIRDRTVDASSELTLSISQCFLKDISTDDPEKLSIYAAWQDDIRKNKGGIA